MKFRTLASLVLLASFTLLLPAESFAASCVIKGGLSPELSAYFEGMDKSLMAIRNEANKHSCDKVKDGKSRLSTKAGEAFSSISKYSNLAFVQDDYVTAGKFSIDMVLRSEVPPAIREHYNILLGKQQEIQEVLENVYDRCAQDISVIQNDYIPTENITIRATLSDVAGKILTEHIKLINFYRSTASWQPVERITPLFGPKTFAEDLEKSHGQKAIETCNKEGSFWDKIVEAGKRIINMSWSIGRGTQEWKDAWKLLQSQTGREERQAKKDLSKELAKDGLPVNEKDSIMNNLWYFSTEEKHRGLSGFVNDLGIQAKKGFDAFGKVYDDLFKKVEEAKTTDQYAAKYQNAVQLKYDLWEQIYSDYRALISSIGNENIANDAKLTRYVNIYMDLDSIDSTLTGKRKTAEAACRQQGVNKWANCSSGKK